MHIAIDPSRGTGAFCTGVAGSRRAGSVCTARCLSGGEILTSTTRQRSPGGRRRSAAARSRKGSSCPLCLDVGGDVVCAGGLVLEQGRL